MRDKYVLAMLGEKPFTTHPVWQWDKGLVLTFPAASAAKLPETYEMHWSNDPRGTATVQIGNRDGVLIPDEYINTGRMVYGWVYVPNEDGSALTVYDILIPVVQRAQPTDYEPTPVEQTAIDQAIAALNAAVVKCEAALDKTPHPDENGIWVVWNAVTGEWESTGISAQGPQGIQGIQGIQGVKGDKGDPGDNYVITQENIDEIGTRVAASQPVTDAISEAQDAALEAEAITYGTKNGVPVPATDPHSENNAKHYAELTQAAETTAVQAINTAGSNQVTAVQNKGDQVLNSIPADYTALSGDVGDLKSIIDDSTELESVVISINLFNPEYLTGAGWTYNPETKEFVGTPYQIRTAYNYELPIPEFKEHTSYCLYFEAYTEGNISVEDTNGPSIKITMSDGNSQQIRIKNNQTAYGSFVVSSYATMANRSVTKITIGYESAGQNIWHFKKIMLVEGYTDLDIDNLPEYQPYGEIGIYSAVDKTARADLETKQEANVGQENAGKVLVVDQAGNIAPVAIIDSSLSQTGKAADAKITGDSFNEIREEHSFDHSINLFNPEYFTGAGWTYNKETNEFVGTPYQIRTVYNYVLPITFKENTKYCLYFDAYTEGNQAQTDTYGFNVNVHMTDGGSQIIKIKNTQQSYASFIVSSYATMGTRSVDRITVGYESAGENIWHLKNVMLVEDYTDADIGNLPEYVPYYEAGSYYTALDEVARTRAEFNTESINDFRSRYPSWLIENKYGHHIAVNRYTNIAIPSQSIFDVEKAKRLGFKIMELNVQKTSDGKYITIHGNNGAFGEQVQLSDGTTAIQSVQISSVTYDYIKQNVRYISTYEKYQTTIPTLEDMLLECHQFGIIPAVQYVNGVIEIADTIVGRGNYILNTYDIDRPSGYTGLCFSWLAISDKDDLLAKVEASGAPYICGINASNSAYSEYTDDDWLEVAEMLHSHGFLAGFVAGYTSESLTQRLWNAGFDFAMSLWCINDIVNPNICDLHGNCDFEDFKIADSAVIDGGALTLQENTNITTPDSLVLPTVFLGGGQLTIRFSGTLTVGMGRYIDTNFTSDGTNSLVISTVFEDRQPNFYAKAIGGSCTIYDISLKIGIM